MKLLITFLTSVLLISPLSAHESPWTSADFLKESFESVISNPKTPVHPTVNQEPKQEEPVERLSNEDFFEQVGVAWVEKLGEYKSTEKHAKFLKDNQVKFFLKEPGLLMHPNMSLTWNPEGIYVNKTIFTMLINAGRNRNFTDDQILGNLLYPLLPVVAHEIGHGMRFEELEQASGSRILIPLLEEETLAQYEMIPVIREIGKQYPQILKTYEPLLNAWKKGPESLNDAVKQSYPGIMTASDDPAGILKKASEAKKKYTAMLEKKRALDKDLAAATDRKERKRIEKALEGAPANKDMEALLERFNSAEALLKDPVKTAQWKEFYASKMKELGELWKKENGPKENK